MSCVVRGPGLETWQVPLFPLVTISASIMGNSTPKRHVLGGIVIFLYNFNTGHAVSLYMRREKRIGYAIVWWAIYTILTIIVKNY